MLILFRYPPSFTGAPCGLKADEAPRICATSSPVSFFLLFFAEIIDLLVEKTNRYYHQYREKSDEGLQLTDVTKHEIFLFLAIWIQMGHDVRDTLKEYWSTQKQFYTLSF